MAAPVRLFLHAPGLAGFDYGPSHPFRLERLELAWGLIRDCGLLEGEGITVREPAPASEEDLLAFHTPDYVEALKRSDRGRADPGDAAYGLGTGDNPVFRGVYRYCLLYAGASLEGARALASGEASAAFNMAGGLHHARAGRASGFCYVNDCVLGILKLLGRFDRVLYVDVDVHHGDGVEAAFRSSDRVLTLSFHESGRWLFPGSGPETYVGEGEGRGFAVNFPFLPGTGDAVWLAAFRDIFPAVLARFRPGAVVAQFGADALAGDPLAHLALGNRALEESARLLAGTGLPLLALGGGGYAPLNVARAWALVWAALAGKQPPEELPSSFPRPPGARGRALLRDPAPAGPGPAEASEEARRVRDYLLAEVMPMVHDRGARR